LNFKPESTIVSLNNRFFSLKMTLEDDEAPDMQVMKAMD
jgi:hypothetical protein